jgi:small subunit ribosomal protein S16
MAVHIRLTRRGAKKAPHYRIVVTDHRNRRDGACLESIGTYDPAHGGGALTVDKARLDYWCGRGAQLSDTLRSLLKRQAAAQPAKV